MRATCGIFRLRADAERAARKLHTNGFGANRVALLTPEDSGGQVGRLPLCTDEGPGVGTALGAAVGCAIGLAAGFELAAIVGAPFPGAATIAGFWGAAILGLAGVLGGAAVGRSFDHAITDGLTQDELLIYEEALRNGRSLLIVFTHNRNATKFARRFLAAEGAESINKVLRDWEIGLRSAKQGPCSGEALQREQAPVRNP